MVGHDEGESFADVEWSAVERSHTVVTAPRLVLLLGALSLAALHLYDTHVAGVYLVFDWVMDPIDWVFLVCLLVLLTGLARMGVMHPRMVREGLDWLRAGRIRFLAGTYLLIVVVGGLLAPIFSPDISYSVNKFNPPPGTSTDAHFQCAGTTTGDAFNEVCHGSWLYPLGTGPLGERVELLMLAGTRPALYILMIGAVTVLPLAITVGVVAGLRGGWVDRTLMTYVDLQLSLPAIIVYFVAFMYVGPSFLLLVGAFVLVSWGGVARTVRSAVISRRSAGHVRVARSLGASERYIATRHVIPTITNALIPAITHFLALLVLFEAGIAFIGFYEVSITSWGAMISESVTAAVSGAHQGRIEELGHRVWWLSTFPALALTLTMASIKLLGDEVRDSLDPRQVER